jgi:hypothetical protein
VITTIAFDAGFCLLRLELGIGFGRGSANKLGFGVGRVVGRYTRFRKGVI